MELRQLKYFVAVAEEGNFGAAARRLNISQPPITRQIQKLEDELGVLLLRRTTKGAELTTSGEVFLEDARQTLAQVARGMERSRAAQRGELGTLEVGYFGSPIYRVVPELLQAFHSALPDVGIALHRMSKGEQVAALQSGQIHIGFGRYYPPEPGIVVEEILREGLSVAVSVDFEHDPPVGERLSIFDKVPLIVFPGRGRPNFADEVLGILKRENVSARVETVAEDVRSALTLTAIGAGATIVPGTVADFSWSGVRFIPLETLRLECPVNCVYRKSETSPILKAMLSTLRQLRAERSREVA
jgi:DNA-binding transcriptional LysR family regulator